MPINNIFANSEYEPTQIGAMMEMLSTATNAQKLGILQYIVLDTVNSIATERELI